MTYPLDQNTVTRRAKFLQNVPLFFDLDETALQRLVQDFRHKSYRANEIIFHQGDIGQELYIILDGRVRVYKTSPSGDETTLVILSTYDVLGEFAVIDGGPRSASARAIGQLDLLSISRETYDHYLQEIPELAKGVTRVLTHKLRWTASYAAAVAQYDAAARLLHILLLYLEKFGQKQDDDGSYLLDLSLNQTELASLVGARREWVNRLLREWSRRGLMTYQPGKIVIHDLPGVEAELDSRIETKQPVW